MSDASAIGYVTQSLQALLRAFITNSGPLSGTDVDLRSPKEISATGSNPTLVSLWLYRVRRHDDLVNAAPLPRPDGRIAMRPLPLDLHYLVTPFAPAPLTRQRLLGMAMQALYDHPRLTAEFLRPELLDEPPAALGIHLEPQSLEESTKVWHALHEPYSLSAAYLVQYVPIPSAVTRPAGPPVLDKRIAAAAIERVA
jgi:hypothetical protein